MFKERFYKFGSSNLFLTGCILFSAGSVATLLLKFSFFSLLSFALLTLPVIIGVWLIFFESKQLNVLAISFESESPKISENSVTGLTLVKIATIANMVFFCISLGILFIGMIIVVIIVAIASELMGGGRLALILLAIFAAVIVFWVLWLIYYYVALLNVIKSISDGIKYDHVSKIKGVGSFIVLSFIKIGFSIFSQLSELAVLITFRSAINISIQEVISRLGKSLDEISPDIGELISSHIPDLNTFPLMYTLMESVRTVFALAASIGLLLIIITLRRFAKSVA